MADGIRVKDLPQYQGDVNTPNVSIPIDGAALTQGNQITGEQLLKPAMDEIAQLGREFLSDRSFSSIPNIDIGYSPGYVNNNYIGYGASNIADCAWVLLFDGSTRIALSGAVTGRVSFFSTLSPDLNSLISYEYSAIPTIPIGARLSIISLPKESNPDGYLNLRVIQGGAGVTKVSLRNFLTDRSFSTIPNIDANWYLNIPSGGGEKRYEENYDLDTAWIQILDDSRTLRIAGATIVRTNFFKNMMPTNDNYISNNTSLDPPIPEGAKMALITLRKSDNPDGYLNLRVMQDGAGATIKRVKEISLTNDFTITGYYLSKDTCLPVQNNNYKITPFKKLNWDQNITLTANDSTASAKICFYDKNRMPISSLYGGGIRAFKDYIIDKSLYPDRAYYYRCSALVSVNDAYVFNANITELDNKVEFLSQNMDRLISKMYIQEVIGKNLINKNDLLLGWAYSASSGFVEKSDGIMGNKLYLSPGKYTLQGVRPFAILTARIVWFNDKDEVVRGDAIALDVDTLTGSYEVTCGTNFLYVTYARLLLQFEKAYPFNPDIAQFELSPIATQFEHAKVKLMNNPNCERARKFCFLTGASNAAPGNGWFENACRYLGYKGRNEAISGESVMRAATRAWRGELYTTEELEDIDVFITSHTHNYDVSYSNPLSTILCETVEEYELKGYDQNNQPLTVPLDTSNPNHRIVPYGGGGAQGPVVPNPVFDERYAAGYDYLLKKYILDCYNLRLNPDSKYYETKGGKPCIIVLCTYWHDAYTRFNSAIFELAKKHGAIICDIAGNVGFSYRQTNPADNNSRRISAEYCNNSAYGSGNDTEDIPINGVMYTGMGWHATRDVNSPLMILRGNILADIFRKF